MRRARIHRPALVPDRSSGRPPGVSHPALPARVKRKRRIPRIPRVSCNETNDIPVALKFLAVRELENQEYKARFVHEAKAAAALDHPNIRTVCEIDEADGRTFMAMAYLEGQTLEEKIAEGPLKLDEALDILAALRRSNGSAPPPYTPTHRRQEDRTLSLGVR